MRRLPPAAILALAIALLNGCAVGPRYQRPQAVIPPAWQTQGPWQLAAPKDALSKGAWWEIFADERLSEYEQQLLRANQSLLAAKDRLDEARSFARVASAGIYPQLSADPSAVRDRVSQNRAVLGATPPTSSITQNSFAIPFSLNYEIDLFGRVRRNLEGANASLQARAADLQSVQLVLSAELAADYFNLRELDAEIEVVRKSIGYQQKGLELLQNQHSGGIVSGLEVAQQQTVLDSTLTQISLLQQQRAQFEHAMAALTGNPASSFIVPVGSLREVAPAIPVGVPSDVLERRPDIATAERAMAVENAQVGIAAAAFYPRILLSGTGGWQSREVASLVSAPSAFWSLGTDLFQPILNGGRNRANLAGAKSVYDESVANYRQSVLVAFQQVEDGMSGLGALSRASAQQRAAVEDARKALELANNRYVGGLTRYLDVITAQTTLLSNERLATQLLGQQMITSVSLVKALGGGWDASLIANEQVHPKAVQAVRP